MSDIFVPQVLYHQIYWLFFWGFYIAPLFIFFPITDLLKDGNLRQSEHLKVDQSQIGNMENKNTIYLFQVCMMTSLTDSATEKLSKYDVFIGPMCTWGPIIGSPCPTPLVETL